MRASKKAEADWQARYAVAGAVYTQDPCGCIMFLVVDLPEEVAYAAKDIASQITLGRGVKRAATRADLPPHYCPTHVSASGQP